MDNKINYREYSEAYLKYVRRDTSFDFLNDFYAGNNAPTDKDIKLARISQQLIKSNDVRRTYESVGLPCPNVFLTLNMHLSKIYDDLRAGKDVDNLNMEGF